MPVQSRILALLALVILPGCVEVQPPVPFSPVTPSEWPYIDHPAGGTLEPTPTDTPVQSPSLTASAPSQTQSSTHSPGPTPSPTVTDPGTATLPPSPTETMSPTPAPTPDADGDGVSIAEGDCAPEDGSIYPGAPDRPFDGVDSNCNNVQDRGVTVMGIRLGERGLATQARALESRGIALGRDGDIYISDGGLCRIRRVRDGIIETVAGNGSCGSGGEGALALSSSIAPGDIAYDTYNDHLYFAEPTHHRLRYLDIEAGTLHTALGTGIRNNPVEGIPLEDVGLCAPGNLTMVHSGPYHLYFTSGGPGEVGCHGGVWQLRTRNPGGDDGDLRRISGLVGCSGMVEGPSRESMACPRGLRVVLNGFERLFVMDDGEEGGGALFRIDSPSSAEPSLLRLAGGGSESCAPLEGGIDALGAGFCGPGAPGGTFHLDAYIPQANGTVLHYDSDSQTLTRVAGSGLGHEPSTSGGAALTVPMGALGPALVEESVLYVIDPEVGQVRALDLEEGVISPVAGRLPRGYLEGGQYEALFRGPRGMAAGLEGDELALYIVDGGNSLVRSLIGGQTARVVGTPGVNAFGGDGGPPGLSTLKEPKKVALDEDGTLYILTEGRIRRVKDGVISTIAGNGEVGYNGDVLPGVEALMGNPSDIALSDDGQSLYIADTDNHRVRRLRLGGELPTIETVLGNGEPGRLEDGAAPLETPMGRPLAISIRGDMLYVAQDTSWAVAQVPLTPEGQVDILAAERGEYGAGVTEVLPLEGEPQSLFVDPFGALFVAGADDRIYRLEGGEMAVIIGEVGQDQYNGDGGALPGLYIDVTPGLSMVMDHRGVLYVSDEGQGVVRSLTF